MENSDHLQQEIKRLEQENKTLTLRVQGVEVLGKVLLESQDENIKLREEVTELKQELTESGVDVSQLSLRSPQSVQPATGISHQSLPAARCFLSQSEDTSLSYEPYEHVPKMPSLGSNRGSITAEKFSIVGSPGKFSIAGSPGLEFHIQDISNGVRDIKDQSQHLLEQATLMFSTIIPTVPNLQERHKLAQKIYCFREKLAKRIQDVNTRETLLQGLVNEEESLKKKVSEMETEQVSQEIVVENLKVELKEYTEELQGIQDEINLFGDAEMVNKEDLSLASMSSRGTSVSGTSTGQSVTTKKRDEGKLESEVTVTRPSCERCFELLKQLNQAVKLTKDAERQKDEILDVNHAWDAQYKKLKTETTKEIKELKRQVEFYKTSETQKKYEAVRSSYKKVIDDERKMKENALEDKRRLDEKVKELEEEVKRSRSLQIKTQVQPPTAALNFGFQSTPLSSLTAQAGESSDLVREIEVLKQQLRIYADDFKCERQDRERMQGEKEKLEADLKESKERITMLEEQVRLYQEDFRKETVEKEQLKSNLRQMLTNRENNQSESQLTQMTRKAQAVAESQAKMRALREQYEREERRLRQEQQGLQDRVMAIRPEPELPPPRRYPTEVYQTRYQPMRPRGARPSDEMFYGGDVQADTRGLGREVPDGPIQGQSLTISCPRCHRSFLEQDFQSFSDHIEKCIE